MYIYYSIGNNSGPRTLVRIVEVSVIGGVRFQRFHCTCTVVSSLCMYSMYVCTVCMYVCMYVCIYVCIYVCMYVLCMYVCMYYVCMYVCMYVVNVEILAIHLIWQFGDEQLNRQI